MELIYAWCNAKPNLIDTAQGIRTIEQNVRNLAAHQIVSVTDDTVKKLTGYNSAGVMKLFKRAFTYTKMNIKDEYWNAYDEMNEYIISVMESTDNS